MKTFLKWLAGVIAVFALLLISIVIIVSLLIDTEPAVVDNSYLHINLSGSLPEYTAPDAFEEALGKVPMDVKRLRDDLEKAAVDDRINGVVLQLEFLSTGFGTIEELHQAIAEFRKSGKKIYAYLGPEVAMTRDYYLATACDSIFMAPTGNLFLMGVGAEVTFYKDFFKKIGVEAEFLQIGRYKNAPDTYTRSSMSPFQREVMENLVDFFYRDIVTTIADSRGFEPDQVESLINNQTGFTGIQAQEAGLVDGIAYFSDLEQKMNLYGSKPTKLSAADYSVIPASSLKIRNRSRIAVVNCVGTIVGGSDSDDPFMGTMMGANSVASNLESAANSSSIKAIILRIDSPGGSATAAEIIWNAVKKASQKKPVIASVSDYGASGGYYIAVGADTMITAPGALVGSIGIFAGKFNIQSLYDKLDINNESIRRGQNSGLFSITEPWTKSERAVVERLISDFYEDFLQKVADSRGMDVEDVRKIAEGRVWTGEEAVKLGLFDFTGSFYDAVETAKSMANIDSSESVRLVYYPRSKSLFNQILSNVSMRLKLVKDLSSGNTEQLIQYLETIQNRPLAMMPFYITFR
jgi:protease-4